MLGGPRLLAASRLDKSTSRQISLTNDPTDPEDAMQKYGRASRDKPVGAQGRLVAKNQPIARATSAVAVDEVSTHLYLRWARHVWRARCSGVEIRRGE